MKQILHYISRDQKHGRVVETLCAKLELLFNFVIKSVTGFRSLSFERTLNKAEPQRRNIITDLIEFNKRLPF